jgi:hypothetical protein
MIAGEVEPHGRDGRGRDVKIRESLPTSIDRSTQILRLLLTSAIRSPKQTITIALCVLATLASTLTYSSYLVIGMLADYLGTGRGLAGLLLAILLCKITLDKQKWATYRRSVTQTCPPAAHGRLVRALLLALFIARRVCARRVYRFRCGVSSRTPSVEAGYFRSNVIARLQICWPELSQKR